MKQIKSANNILGPCAIIIVFIMAIWWLVYYLYKHNFFRNTRDLFQNMHPTLGNAGEYPFYDLNPLLVDVYPLTGRKGVSNDNYPNIWFYYPSLPLGNFEQITNNLRYRYNPDDGQCITADFCGAIYKDKKVKSNVAHPLPPVKPGEGARVNYYRNKYNILL